jgi:CelD/BcsL family acetyltransferase involved in cellulose biosynthesis
MIEVITELEALQSLEADWIALCKKSDATPFQTPMWLLGTWR